MYSEGGNMISYCGLNCSECEAYMATQEDSSAKREETAEKWSQLYKAVIKPEQINCDGCKESGWKFFHCNNCEIRQCCTSNSVVNCAACENYICETLTSFIKLAPEI